MLVLLTWRLEWEVIRLWSISSRHILFFFLFFFSSFRIVDGQHSISAIFLLHYRLSCFARIGWVLAVYLVTHKQGCMCVFNRQETWFIRYVHSKHTLLYTTQPSSIKLYPLRLLSHTSLCPISSLQQNLP